jgi:glycosyltransferase involved in cell wall biosynthesis
MRISVVTVCYNAAHTLADAVDSVLGQTSDPSAPLELEYIVVDGGSTDGTLDLLARYRNRIATLISEPDNGLYDAMNKGIKAATGEVVAILNADDVYASTDVLARVADTFRDSGAEAVYGDLNYVTADDLSKVTRRWNAGPYTPGAFRRGWMPPHPALFVRRACYDRWGLFTLSLRSAADYELMLRFIHRHGMTLAYLPETLVLMRAGGVSNASLKHRIRAHREDWKAWRMNGFHPSLFTLLAKPLRKLPQFLSRA